MPVPAARLRPTNDAPLRADRDYVLYWMIASRRVEWNFALDRALELGRELGRPVLVFEPLRLGYRWASARHHVFVLQGMAYNQAALAGGPIGYLPYVEEQEGEGKGLLAALAARACAVVTDDWPGFFMPRMVAAAAQTLDVRLEAVDGAGIVPVREAGRAFSRAVDFRRHLQKTVGPHLIKAPAARADLTGLARFEGVPEQIRGQWPPASQQRLGGDVDGLALDHDVGPVALQGGSGEARQRWCAFRDQRLATYGEGRNHPDDDGSSGLSPWLHFGHISTHELWADIVAAQGWSLGSVAEKARGQRSGWWGLSPGAEAFLDQVVTWRELGLNGAVWLPDHDSYGANPEWARRTLHEHANDERPERYDLSTLDAAETDDPLWNAAQRQLRESGVMHNYLRMLWGKKVLEWAPTPQLAFDWLLHLNNRYALDGRDPNSTAGVAWVFGRYDRAWGPERPIYGKIRYMTSDSTMRKLRLKGYLEEWG